MLEFTELGRLRSTLYAKLRDFYVKPNFCTPSLISENITKTQSQRQLHNDCD
jgi:hypothetical protein